MIDLINILKTISIYECMFSVFILFKSFYKSKIPFSILSSNIKDISDELPSGSIRQFYYICTIILTLFINITTWKNHSNIPELLALPPITMVIVSTELFKTFFQKTKTKIRYQLQYFSCILISKFINISLKGDEQIRRQIYPYEILQTFHTFNTLDLTKIITKIIKAVLYDYVNYIFEIVIKTRFISKDVSSIKSEIANIINTGDFEKLLSSYIINRLIVLYKHSGNNVSFYQKLNKIFRKIKIQLLFIYGYWGLCSICEHYWNIYSASILCFLTLPYRDDKKRLIIYEISYNIYKKKKINEYFFIIMDFLTFSLFFLLTKQYLFLIIFYLYIHLLPIDYTDYNIIGQNIKLWFKKNWLILILLYFWHGLFSLFNPIHLLVITIEFYFFNIWKNYKVNYKLLSKEATIIEEKYFEHNVNE